MYGKNSRGNIGKETKQQQKPTNGICFITAISQQPGEQLQLFYDKCVDGYYCGSRLNKYNAADSGARFSEVTTQLTSTVSDCINHRLQDLEVKPVLEAATILFQPKEWPTDRDQLAVFGNTYLTTLAQHFKLMLRKLGCDEEQVKSMKHAEWPSFKQFASRNKETRTSAFDDQELHARFPTILKLTEIVLVIPMYTWLPGPEAHQERLEVKSRC